MVDNPWPADVVSALYAELEKRGKENLSFAEIGRRIGRSKGQVMGYVSRHCPQYQDKNRATPQAKVRKPSFVFGGGPENKKPPTIVKFAEGGPKPLKKPMTPVIRGECSYVFGEPGSGKWAYCGHKTRSKKESYCEFHHRVTRSQYQPVDKEIKEA